MELDHIQNFPKDGILRFVLTQSSLLLKDRIFLTTLGHIESKWVDTYMWEVEGER